MPTILELFKNNPYQSFGNKTAEEVFEVRNSKDIEITSTNAILNNTSFKLAKIARKNLSSRLKETRLEEEVTGVRIIRGLSEPVLYGTEYPRLLKRTTNILDSMKNDRVGGDENSNGILGNALNKIEEKGKGLLSKLGVDLPEKLIPTKIKLNDDFKSGTTLKLPETLAKIRKDGAGNILGKFLAKSASGTPNQIGNQLIGNAIGGAKDAVRSALFGSGKTGENLVSINKSSRNFDNTSIGGNYTTLTKAELKDDVIKRNDLSTVLQNIVNPPPVDLNPNNAISRFAFDINNTIPKIPKQRYSTTDHPLENGLFSKRMISGSTDDLNSLSPFEGETHTFGNNKTSDEIDFVALKFYSVAQNKTVQFRATLSGVSETISPSWNTNKMVGNPFNFYTYEGVERSLQFEFKIYSLNENEHTIAWEKLSFLTSLVYPQNFQGDSLYTIPPIIKFTLGDMYKSKPAFIDSLSYSIDDNTPWEVGLNSDSTKNFKLPMIVNASVAVKFIENYSSLYEKNETNVYVAKNLYGYKKK